MNLDISEYTDIEIRVIIGKLNDLGYHQIDEAYVEKESPVLNNFGIVLYPKLLSYYNGKKWVIKPWICLEIEIEDDVTKLDKFTDWLKKDLELTGFKLFKDEDAYRGNFTKINGTNYVTLRCYMNTSYPDGYWSNHTL